MGDEEGLLRDVVGVVLADAEAPRAAPNEGIGLTKQSLEDQLGRARYARIVEHVR